MTKAHLERALCAAGAVARDHDFIVFGSQAILGLVANPPKACLVSMELDIYPRNNFQAARLIIAKLGRRSVFSKRNGYFLDCVAPELATLPEGWTERLVPFCTTKTRGVTAWCLEIHDLVVSKVAAGRDKDLKYIRALLRHKLVQPGILENRLADTQVSESKRNLFRARLKQLRTGSRQAPHRKPRRTKADNVQHP